MATAWRAAEGREAHVEPRRDYGEVDELAAADNGQQRPHVAALHLKKHFAFDGAPCLLCAPVWIVCARAQERSGPSWEGRGGALGCVRSGRCAYHSVVRLERGDALEGLAGELHRLVVICEPAADREHADAAVLELGLAQPVDVVPKGRWGGEEFAHARVH